MEHKNDGPHKKLKKHIYIWLLICLITSLSVSIIPLYFFLSFISQQFCNLQYNRNGFWGFTFALMTCMTSVKEEYITYWEAFVRLPINLLEGAFWTLGVLAVSLFALGIVLVILFVVFGLPIIAIGALIYYSYLLLRDLVFYSRNKNKEEL